MERPWWVLGLVAVLTIAVLAAPSGADPGRSDATVEPGGPIEHIVIIDLENHSFDDVLGKLCVRHHRGTFTRSGLDMPCDGTSQGVLQGGEPYRLRLEPNQGLHVTHSVRAQQWAIDGGEMDGFSTIGGCRRSDRPRFGCLMQFDPLRGDCGRSGTQTCIPNIARYAAEFAISDRTFAFRATPSWASHLVLGSATMQRFSGWNPIDPPGQGDGGPGWGCDSGRVSRWQDGDVEIDVPSCIPDVEGSMGPLWRGYEGPHAAWAPTIFDRMEQAGLRWRIYSGNYNWSICPTFWSCRGSAQFEHHRTMRAIFDDLDAGVLPEVSFVIPPGSRSGHPPGAMSRADTWLGRVVSAIMHRGPWVSTAVFVTFDDCGCFFDHVNPWAFSRDFGPRLPMLIVSPYARAGFTDSTPTSFISMLTFVEHTFGLEPLAPCDGVDVWDEDCTDDATGPQGAPAYDYADAFDFTQVPLRPVPAVRTWLSHADRSWLGRYGSVDHEP